jgi:hypothetical protein
MHKLRIVTGFGWEIAHEAVSRRPPISLDTIVARTRMYTYAATVWDLAVVQGPVTATPCQTLLWNWLYSKNTLPRKCILGGHVVGFDLVNSQPNILMNLPTK